MKNKTHPFLAGDTVRQVKWRGGGMANNPHSGMGGTVIEAYWWHADSGKRTSPPGDPVISIVWENGDEEPASAYYADQFIKVETQCPDTRSYLEAVAGGMDG